MKFLCAGNSSSRMSGMHTFASANLQSTSLDDRVAPRSFEKEEEDGTGANFEARYA